MAVGVPAVPLGMAATFTAPVVYFPAATAVCSAVVGVIVVPACVLICDVLLPETVTVPAVPEDTYPAVTVGVTFLLALAVAVIRPLASTLIVGLTVIVVAGVLADPLATLFEAASS